MTAPPSDPRARDEAAALRGLLREAGDDPLERVAELAARRLRLVPDAETQRELDAQELRFLQQRARGRGASETLVAAVEEAAGARLELERRSLEASDASDAASLFELVEVAAALRARGEHEAAAATAAGVAERVQAVAIDDSLLFQASEAYAVLATEQEELDLRHKVLLLEETAGVLRRLAVRARSTAREQRTRGARTRARRLASLARRLGNMAHDRKLVGRLEGLLGRRGATALEITSLTGLFVVLGLLLVEATVPLAEGTRQTTAWIDASICLFFIAEFLFKFALAPARWSWARRHLLTDLLPAIPAALIFLDIPAPRAGDEAVAVRLLRLLRITWFARYVRALRPLLGLLRFVLFLLRGLDTVVERFSPLLNRNFVFFESGAVRGISAEAADDAQRRLLFETLQREHVLLADLPRARTDAVLVERARGLAVRLTATPAETADLGRGSTTTGGRDVPVEEAIETLYGLRPEDLPLRLPRKDLQALDRFVRVVNAPLIRSLPIVRRLRSARRADSPEERIVDLAQRIAGEAETWRGRLLFLADLHGVVTGPQVLDRIATAMVKASQRPAVRLLLFGGLFTIVRLILGDDNALGEVLKRFVATPLVVLGAVCLVVLMTGRWLKTLAGEAAESLGRTAEAHFVNLLRLHRSRRTVEDLDFLARRVFGRELEVGQAAAALRTRIARLRDGDAATAAPPATGDLGRHRELVERTALLYLDFLDGALLHEGDIKTGEQLLANLSLANIRDRYLRISRKEHKRLRRLSLDGAGGLLSGPHLWFRFITESVALETAKRILEYNRNCMTREQRARAPATERAAMDAWLERRRARVDGRALDKVAPAEAGDRYRSTEFHALDFLGIDPEREDQLAALFGTEVVEVLRADRQRMLREIFGTRPIARLPRAERSLNLYTFYRSHLSRGRVVFLPLVSVLVTLRFVRIGIARTAAIVREILAPEAAAARRQSGRADFSVAQRKIHRMKMPALLELIRTRVAFDPEYVDAPVRLHGTDGRATDAGAVAERAADAATAAPPRSELQRDLDWLGLKDREREELEQTADTVRRHAAELQVHAADLQPVLAAVADGCPLRRRHAELALTVAWITDRDGLRRLMRLPAWEEETLAELRGPELHLPLRPLRAFWDWMLHGRGLHPVDVWLRRRGLEADGRLRRQAHRAWRLRLFDLREMLPPLTHLPAETSPEARALDLARAACQEHDECLRDLVALRAIQASALLDVRHYLGLVFRLGGYDADGEDLSRALEMP